MKRKAHVMSVREVKSRLSEAIALSQGAYVLITRHGRPVAIMIGVKGLDLLEVTQRFAKLDVLRPPVLS